ncbi:MAG: hypothetical protein ACP5N9_03420 [Candidatus Bilamarchaeum sp.]
MDKNKLWSYFFLVIGLLVITVSTYLVLYNAGDVILAVSDLLTKADSTKFAQCGLQYSSYIDRYKTDFAPIIIPFIVFGVPILALLLSFVMFLSGFYYGKTKVDSVSKPEAEINRNHLRNIVSKVEKEKSSSE